MHGTTTNPDALYGSTLPGATTPDVFYETLDAAAADCSMGPCTIVHRPTPQDPWSPVPTTPRAGATP